MSGPWPPGPFGLPHHEPAGRPMQLGLVKDLTRRVGQEKFFFFPCSSLRRCQVSAGAVAGQKGVDGGSLCLAAAAGRSDKPQHVAQD